VCDELGLGVKDPLESGVSGVSWQSVSHLSLGNTRGWRCVVMYVFGALVLD